MLLKRKFEVDMLEGPLLKNMVYFAIPLFLSGILQLLFNATNIIVVGQFVGGIALAAVGSTSSLINLLLNLVMGISVGASVVMGKYFGARKYTDVKNVVSTSMITAVVSGCIMLVVGVFFSEGLLNMMGTPEDVIELASVYMRIYFIGMPGFLVYNFGAALFRAVGDTKRPLYFLVIAGIVNTVLNLVFVMVFNWGVAGAAAATALSQFISGGLILYSLIRSDNWLHLNIKKLVFSQSIFMEIVKIGLPAGVQGMIFNISNVLIQSTINSFGSVIISGNTAATNIEGFVYVGMNVCYQTALSFTSQNMGVRKYSRIQSILKTSLLMVVVMGVVVGVGAFLCGDVLLGMYTQEPIIVEYGLIRLGIICNFYFLCGIMDVYVGVLRGMGYSIVPMMVSLIGVCVFRIFWIYTIFSMSRSLEMLYISYPISWSITLLAHAITFHFIYKKVNKAPAIAMA